MPFILNPFTGLLDYYETGGGGGTVTSVSGTPNRITSTGGATPVIDIASNYVGQTSLTTVGTITTGTWQGSVIGAIYGGTSQNSYAVGDTLYASAINTLNKLTAGSDGQVLTLASGIPSWATPTTGTVTSVSGTANRITSTGGITPVIDISGSYVGQSSITTLGTITTGVWNGTVIDLAHGGTNANLTANTGGIFYSTSTAGAILAGTATANQILMSGSTAAPAWSTATYPATTTINQLLYSSSNNVVAGITAANNGTLISGTTGIPSWLANGTTGQVLTATAGSPPSWQAAAGGGVTSVTGTANQINSTGGTTPVLTLSSTVITPGSLVTTTTLTSTTLFTALAGQVIARTTSATDYTVLVTDFLVGITSTAAARTVTLPAAPSTPQVFIIKDESGAASINNISVLVSGGTNIDGAATQKIYTNYGSMTVYHAGSGVYFIM